MWGSKEKAKSNGWVISEIPALTTCLVNIHEFLYIYKDKLKTKTYGKPDRHVINFTASERDKQIAWVYDSAESRDMEYQRLVEILIPDEDE